MEIVELLSLGSKLLEKMSKCGIKTDDYQYVGLYEDFVRMRSSGEKYWYAVMVLSKKYKLSESKVVRLIRRLGKSV